MYSLIITLNKLNRPNLFHIDNLILHHVCIFYNVLLGKEIKKGYKVIKGQVIGQLVQVKFRHQFWIHVIVCDIIHVIMRHQFWYFVCYWIYNGNVWGGYTKIPWDVNGEYNLDCLVEMDWANKYKIVTKITKMKLTENYLIWWYRWQKIQSFSTLL